MFTRKRLLRKNPIWSCWKQQGSLREESVFLSGSAWTRPEPPCQFEEQHLQTMVVYLPDGEQRRQALQGLQPSLSCTWLVCYFPHWLLMCVCLSGVSSGLLAGRQGEVSLALWAYRGWPNTLVPSSLAPTSPWIVYCTSACSYNSAFSEKLPPSSSLCC